MKRIYLMLLLSLLISSGFAFNIQITPVDSSVKPGGTIEYDISLINDASASRTVILYMISDKLIPSFTPSYTIVVLGLSTTHVNLKAPVPESATQGRYYDSVYFDIDNIIQSSQTISYTVEGPEQYFMFYSVEVPSTVDPRSQFNAVINFENAYNRKIEKVYATVEVYKDDGSSLYYSINIIDTPLGNNSVNIPITLNPSLTPSRASIRVGLSWYDISLGSKVEEFSIVGYAVNNTESFSSTTITTTTNGVLITNNGTLVILGFDYEVKISSLDSLFISGASLDYTMTADSVIFHVPELYPGDSVELYYELNYSVLYLLPFLVMGVIYLIYYFTRSISVKREIFEFKSSHNTIAFKVVMNITNVSKNNINHVRVKEFLPMIITDVYDYGTLHGEVKHGAEGKFIEWNLGKLKPGENVILSYRMRSKVGYIGELRLDQSMVEIVGPSGEIQSVVKTNTILVDISPKKKTEPREE